MKTLAILIIGVIVGATISIAHAQVNITAQVPKWESYQLDSNTYCIIFRD